jgi:hypothetical protein
MVTAPSPTRAFIAMLLAVFPLAGAGCVAYPVAVVPAPAPVDKYDRVWDSALRAADDVGIQVTGAEKSSGYISGARGAIAAQIFVLRQADGAVRVQLDLKGPLDQDPGLADRFSRAYERYMGR